jgi:hypothetical protein
MRKQLRTCLMATSNDSSDAGDASGVTANVNSDVSGNNEADSSSETTPGHGRLGADDYPGADQVDVSHPELSPGDACPDCVQGTLYEKSPGVLVRFKGQAPLHATVYRMQKLRCHLCGKLFTAPSPAGVSDDKFDHTVASMIGLLKYGNGMPFNRVDRGCRGVAKFLWQPRRSGTLSMPRLCSSLRLTMNSSARRPRAKCCITMIRPSVSWK